MTRSNQAPEDGLALFGTRRQTALLLLLALLEESYPRELARLSGTSMPAVINLIDKLEIQGVLATRQIGKERRVALNRRYFAYSALRDLLVRLAEADNTIQKLAASVRRRPRRKGKPL